MRTDKTSEMEVLFAEGNSVLRSAFQIAERHGEDTNWTAFRNRVDAVLKNQHETINEIRKRRPDLPL